MTIAPLNTPSMFDPTLALRLLGPPTAGGARDAGTQLTEWGFAA
jgi:hypothetical protein